MKVATNIELPIKNKFSSTSPWTFKPHHLSSTSSWHDFLQEHFPWLEQKNSGQAVLPAVVDSFRFSNVTLATISVGACEIVRTRQQAHSETGFVKLIWRLSGALQVDQDGRTCILEAAQVAVCDTSRPYRIRLLEKTSFFILMLPYENFPNWESMQARVCGRKLAEGAITQAAFGALATLANFSSDAIKADGDIVVRAVQWMISTTFHKNCGDVDEAVPTDGRIGRARRFILSHISDPDLSVDAVAAALCMSRRSLYHLFSEYQITPGKMILDIRLQQAIQILGNPKFNRMKATEIAFGSGFNDYATFSRLFKLRYGLSPSEYRLKATSQERLSIIGLSSTFPRNE